MDHEQVWVADITYLSTQSKFVYLRLATGAYSRKLTDEHVHARKVVAAKASRAAAGQQNGASGSTDIRLRAAAYIAENANARCGEPGVIGQSCPADSIVQSVNVD